jgi:hypothetical protein
MTVIKEVLTAALSELTIRSVAEGIAIYAIAAAVVVFWVVMT